MKINKQQQASKKTRTTKDEINESKQILLNKHLSNDQKQIRKFNAIKNRLNFRRDTSDDCISSNYPNSSYSTFRDMTNSSISSILAESGCNINENNSIEPSSSFEYDQSDDYPQRQPLNRWENYHNLNLQNTIIGKFVPSDGGESDQSIIYKINNSIYNFDLDSLSESDPSTVKSYSPKSDLLSTPEIINDKTNINNNKNNNNQKMLNPNSKNVFLPIARPTHKYCASYDEGSNNLLTAMKMQSHANSGYTNEHLARAMIFGSVIDGLKKPGHHIGPVRNPQCKCDHCRRWMAERDDVRGRALSVGDEPITQTRLGLWLRRFNNNNHNNNCS